METGNIEIIYQDESVLVCVKPFGLLSQSDTKNGENLVSVLGGITGGEIFPVHRLDKETGGVMVFAKTSKTAATLSRQITEDLWHKEYIALVHGKPEKEKGIFEDLLFKDSGRNKSYVVKKERKGVRKAVLEYETLNTNEELTAVRVVLKTGRTHQVRVQFASRGMPLTGDRKYGAKDDFKTLGLWSARICFKHPVTSETLEFCKEPQNYISDYLN
jgi:23S rRNA pseudouridine1911/1915/1917 synthase